MLSTKRHCNMAIKKNVNEKCKFFFLFEVVKLLNLFTLATPAVLFYYFCHNGDYY